MRDPVMVGDRVYLRALDAGDAAAFARAAADERTSDSKTGRLPIPGMVWAHEFDGAGTTPGMPTHISFAVVRRSDDALLGSLGLIDVDWLHRTAESATHLLSEGERGRGYGTEAKMLLLEYAFDRIHLHAVRAWVRSTNARSIAALARQGYRPAGRRRWTTFHRGELIDHLILDVLRDDWLAARDAWRADQRVRFGADAAGGNAGGDVDGGASR